MCTHIIWRSETTNTRVSTINELSFTHVTLDHALVLLRQLPQTAQQFRAASGKKSWGHDWLDQVWPRAAGFGTSNLSVLDKLFSGHPDNCKFQFVAVNDSLRNKFQVDGSLRIPK